MKKDSKSLIVVMSIIFLIYTMIFVVVQITRLPIIANIFVIICFLVYWRKGISVLNNHEKYPWAATNSVLLQRYFAAVQVLLLIAVHMSPRDLFVKPVVGFLSLNLLVFAVFAIWGIMQNNTASAIRHQQEKAKQNIFVLKALVSDMEILTEKAPYAKPVLEALKDADPLQNISLEEFDAKIKDDCEALKNAVDEEDDFKASALCIALQDVIRNRNNRAYLLRNYKE